MTAYELLAPDGDRRVLPPGVEGPEDLLADLYHQPLIITPGYVGRDRRISTVPHSPERRRASDRRHPRDGGGSRDRSAPGPSLRTLEILVVVVSTILVAVPLALMASRAPTAGISSHPASPHPASSPPGARIIAAGGAAAGHPGPGARATTRAGLVRATAARRTAASQRRQASALHARQASRARAVRHAAGVRRQARARQARARARALARARARVRAQAQVRAHRHTPTH